MDCSRCGTPAIPGDRVCRVCGAPLALAAQEPPRSAPQEEPTAALPTTDPEANAAPDVIPFPTIAPPVAAPPVATSSAPAATTPQASTNGAAPPAPYPNAAYGAYGAYGPYSGYAAYAGYPPWYGYPYVGYYGYYYPYPPAPAKPPRPQGETYRQVLGWIVTIGSALALVVGLFFLLVVAIASTPSADLGLLGISEVAGLAIAGLAGGAAGIYFGITAILRRPSVRFSLPPAWLWLVLTVAALGAGVVIWHEVATPGATLVALPLVLLAGVLPALTVLAYGGQLLGFPSTWRHTVLSLIYGATLAAALAALLEFLADLFIAFIAQALGLDGSIALANLTNQNPRNVVEAVIFFLTLAVVPPLAEEGLKPLGAILVMPRVRGAGEAFFLGLAAGVGFDMIETVGYFGLGQADWISIAIGRIGGGLVHGVGAGMGALGWYYLLRGKGVPHRWLRGFGAIGYALLQHGIFNGSNLLYFVPGPIGQFMRLPLYLGRLPLGQGTGLFLAFYVIIFGVLTYVALRLGRAERATPPATPQPGGAESSGQPAPTPMPEPVGGGAR